MASLERHRASVAHKILLLGNSGAGKTGLLGSLANAGKRLFIMDYDNGLDILLDPKVVLPEFRKNIFYRTLTDKLTGPRGIPAGMPTALPNGMALLDKWTEFGDETRGPMPGLPADPTTALDPSDNKWKKVIEMGSPYTWGSDDVIVLDSLTFFGEAAMRWVLASNSHVGRPPQMQHWGEAIRIQENVLGMLFSDQVRCNVIVTAHLAFIEQLDATTGLTTNRTYPSALGQKLPPKVGRYFNSVLLIEKRPGNAAQPATRVLKTVATAQIELKNPAPSKVPAEMEADLAKYFSILSSV